MKINSGLFSTNTEADKWFMTGRKEAIEYLPKIVDIAKNINELKKKKMYTTEFSGVWYDKFESFKEIFGTYPNKNLYTKLTDELKKLEKEKKDNSFFEQAKDKVKGLI